MMEATRRVCAVAGHLRVPVSGASPANADLGYDVVAGGAARPLSDAQLADFTRKGFCMFTIPEEEVPSSHHAQYYADIFASSHAGADNRHVEMPVDAISTVLDSPSFSGALRSILGPA
jgi:hypothetical protein